MATSSGRKTSSSRKRSGTSKTKNRNTKAYQAQNDSALFHEIGLIAIFVFMIILFFCNFGFIGPVGDYISGVLFGLFGFSAYIAPVFCFLMIAFGFANEGNPNAKRKIIASVVLFFMFGVVCDLIVKNASQMEKYSFVELYKNCRDLRHGGGAFAGSITYFLHDYLETFGTVLVVLLLCTISFILLTEKSLLESVRDGGSKIREMSEQDAIRRRENAMRRREELDEIREQREEEKRLRAEERENDRILRMEKKVKGVTFDTTLKPKAETGRRDDMHEIVCENVEFDPVVEPETHEEPFDFGNEIRIHKEEAEPKEEVKPVEEVKSIQEVKPKAEKINNSVEDVEDKLHKDIQASEKNVPKKYMFPPISRLQKGTAASGDSTRELKETALRLQQTLSTFGVKVTITDISQGPSVTRYELQPEQGVKVSKIVGLADDIKLNLAATDIRMEAPIPGKAAIGIEVPNKENMMVALRDLLESKEFKEFPSNLAFAVGKDISGKVIVADIAKMPHMLIAGSTGSGKSVCINTLIMSILYKAHPDDVKLIMVDPKVVELSVYNGIPHLLIPVVTDPKKASAALHWGVSEMEDRYRKFADMNVRDLKGYNKKIEGMQVADGEELPKKLPQIVIIVDELADLMMVSPGEVEESICRLAQLARAAGIHLVIATQRPSVDVITGLIKANMPSRVAFAVSSGVDSRTILDMNGAEKLLGKGDMLFYPQGYTKPARIQGAFVSDREVSDVVDFLKNQTLGNTYAEDIEEQIKSIGTGSSSQGGSGGSERDEYFAEAGRFIIDKDKASIGMLQRVFKIGFNRAARIMDQLCEYGVVGEEEGTKPRKILM
ncbi:MAG: DNA translocase FtsK, partial [Acetatifactor sp.]|nr:DNA translocase FtsK [Acetatifactor sp.]